jgi:hypothetical protein
VRAERENQMRSFNPHREDFREGFSREMVLVGLAIGSECETRT